MLILELGMPIWKAGFMFQELEHDNLRMPSMIQECPSGTREY